MQPRVLKYCTAAAAAAVAAAAADDDDDYDDDDDDAVAAMQLAGIVLAAGKRGHTREGAGPCRRQQRPSVLKPER